MSAKTAPDRNLEANLDSGQQRAAASRRRQSALGSAQHFARHFVEMFLAMMVGMMALGALDGGILSAAGTSVTHVKNSAPAAFALVMALDMTVGMTLWMRYRRHSWAMCAEMGGAMFLPAIAALVLLWCSVIHTGSVGAVEMVAMLPAMLAAMLYRRVEYSQSIRTSGGSR